MTDAAAAPNGALKPRSAHVWARDPHDYYREPRWVADALFKAEKFGAFVYDPCAGSGNIVDAALAAGHTAEGADLIDRAGGRFPQHDALTGFVPGADAIVSNPPFKLCNVTPPPLPERLLGISQKLALLLPATWLNGLARSRWLETTPLYRVWLIAPRPAMPPGDIVAAGQKAGNGTTDFAWFVWLDGYDGRPEIRWLRRDG